MIWKVLIFLGAIGGLFYLWITIAVFFFGLVNGFFKDKPNKFAGFVVSFLWLPVFLWPEKFSKKYKKIE